MPKCIIFLPKTRCYKTCGLSFGPVEFPKLPQSGWMIGVGGVGGGWGGKGSNARSARLNTKSGLVITSAETEVFGVFACD